MKLGFFFSCYKENRAVENSLSELRKHYPDNPIYLVSDGGFDFNYLKDSYDNLFVSLEEDTMSSTFNITDQNWREEVHQNAIRQATYAVLNRLERAIEYCQTDYILMMDPDALVRGQLNIPEGVKLLGSRVNTGLPVELQVVLSRIPGAKVINCWGATPALFETKTFMDSWTRLKASPKVMDAFIDSFYAIYAHDVLLPLVFALAGEEETFNPDIVECNRNPNWRNTSQPLVHQFKEFY
jgi:hypothetical protein